MLQLFFTNENIVEHMKARNAALQIFLQPGIVPAHQIHAMITYSIMELNKVVIYINGSALWSRFIKPETVVIVKENVVKEIERPQCGGLYPCGAMGSRNNV
jgi:hypothetical protein